MRKIEEFGIGEKGKLIEALKSLTEGVSDLGRQIQTLFLKVYKD